MIKKFIFFLLFSLISVQSSIAVVDVVYPTAKNTVINAPDTFVLGNVPKGSKVLINGTSAKLWEDTFFVEMINLNYGKNDIVFSEIKNGEKEDVTYTVTRNKYTAGTSKTPTAEYFPENEIWYTKTINDNSTVRLKPSSSGGRAVELGQNIVLYLEAKQGDYYKIKTNSNDEYWIHKSNLDTPVLITKKMHNTIKRHRHVQDENYDYHKFHVTYPVFYTLKQVDNSLKLTIFGIDDKNFEYTFDIPHTILGYDCYYENGKFVLRIAKTPQVSPDKILKGIKIFIDAGHGGVEKGAVGPTRINEKDINLAISNKLITLLKNDGANVVYSRTDDRKVGLYDRVKTAKDNNALISISIHCNSLPNGKSPYIQHGTEVHYYNENAVMLAKIINANLVQDLNFKNNGIHNSSFALDRATNPVSVLVETAYIINPDEYIMLKNPQIQDKIAQSIDRSIKQYIELISSK